MQRGGAMDLAKMAMGAVGGKGGGDLAKMAQSAMGGSGGGGMGNLAKMAQGAMGGSGGGGMGNLAKMAQGAMGGSGGGGMGNLAKMAQGAMGGSGGVLATLIGDPLTMWMEVQPVTQIEHSALVRFIIAIITLSVCIAALAAPLPTSFFAFCEFFYARHSFFSGGQQRRGQQRPDQRSVSRPRLFFPFVFETGASFYEWWKLPGARRGWEAGRPAL